MLAYMLEKKMKTKIMIKKIILSSILGLAFMMGGHAQEKKNVKPKAEVTKKLRYPEANVNFEEIQNPNTLGIDEISRKTIKIDGMIVGDNPQSYPFQVERTQVVSFDFKTDNPNAMYYIQDRLGTNYFPATSDNMKEELRPGHYILNVGLTPEAIKNEEKATYTVVIQ